MAYLRLFAVSAAISFALAWAWVVAAPMAFMDPEYPSWRAKQLMLERCDLGDAIVLGDSRAAVDILPTLLPIGATNLAVGGSMAIEAYATLARALACPSPLKLVIISIDANHFTHPDLFWERSVRFGFMSASDVATLRDASLRIGDTSVYEARHTDGLPSIVRDRLYQMRFPPFYAASLIHGGGIVRWAGNRARLQQALASRGQYYFGTAAGSDIVAVEGTMPGFRPLPILDLYFDRLLALLAARGIPAWFIAMPVNESTWRQVRPAMLDQFAAYLAAYERRYPLFHVVGDIMPHWPDRFFGDPFCHLNPDGAQRFSALLAQRLQDAPPSTQNEAQNGWLSETGRDASAKVRPISKRGS
jgi:hypothetical protein